MRFAIIILAATLLVGYNMTWQHSCMGEFRVGMKVTRIVNNEVGVLAACSGNFVTVDFGNSTGATRILKSTVVMGE